MKLPRKLRAFGCDFEIVYERSETDLDPKYQGRTWNGLRRITLAGDVMLCRVAKTLVHEIVHIMLNHMGMEEHNETEVLRMENALWAMLADNPDVFYWIIKNRDVRTKPTGLP